MPIAARRLFLIAFAAFLFPLATPALAGAVEQAMITQYYLSILHRDPEAGAVAYWDGEVTRMRNGGLDAREAFIAMSSQFFNGVEYRGFARSNAAYVTDLYQTFFQRAPDTGGFAYWQSQLTQGLPRTTVLAGFQFSTEFDAYMSARLGSAPTRPEGTVIIDFYLGFLSRLPEDGGLSYWMAQLRQAQCSGGAALTASAESISSQFLNGVEYAGRARTNAEFVGDMYSAFMRRYGDVASTQWWVNQLNSGVSRDSVRRAFLNGAEFQGRLNAVLAAGCFTTLTAKDAARLLQQGTWGASLAEINRVTAIGTDAWLNEQFATPAASYTAYAQQNLTANKAGAHGCTDPTNGCPWQVNFPTFYQRAFEGNDQLRQRVVNALLEMVVISIANNRIQDAGTGMPNYLDMLGTHAFGNYRELLKNVALHPGMGVYLDMLASSLEQPNENFARENLQLFSIGTVMLNDDGTPQTDGLGNKIPTYGEDVVKGFAKAFTGWHFADQDMTKSWKFYWPDENWTVPMKPWTARRCPQDGHWPPGSATWCDLNVASKSYPPPHDTGTKKLLQYAGAPYANLPAGQTPEVDLENAVDNIFNHPNVGPFVSKQLIQRLVTSNPTPAYVQRVARVFNNNGANVRGDMKAVVRAILTDNEARSATIAAGNTFGKLREPVHKFLHLHRAFSAQSSSHYYNIWDLSDPEELGQAPLRAPSVFNYFGAAFSPSGPIGQAGLVGPEFEITTTSVVTGFSEFTKWAVVGGFGQYDSDPGAWIKPNYDRYLVGAGALADNPQAMVDELDLLLTAGSLKTQFKSDLVAALNKVTRGVSADQRSDRFRIAMWQIIHSAEYAVQR